MGNDPTDQPASDDAPDLQPDEEPGELPAAYGTQRVWLTARDPHWLVASWDVDFTPFRAAAERFFLRIIDTATSADATSELQENVRHWHVPASPGAECVAELGWFAKDGDWVPVARSLPVRAPVEAPASSGPVVFATIPPDAVGAEMEDIFTEGEGACEAIARLAQESEACDAWSGSLVEGALPERFFAEAAAVPSSWSAEPVASRGFFMHVNAEIVFYGGTQPGSKVCLNGQPVMLKPDGSFFFHFTLPDGAHEAELTAESPDGSERRAVTLRFSRETAATGEVTATPQPPYIPPFPNK